MAFYNPRFMELIALPAFEDNYLWLLHDGRQALVVDPGDAAPVAEALARLGLRLACILVTHHHGDHTGGVAALREATGARVHGPARERIPEPFVPQADGDVVQALGLSWRVIDVPGHTAGHIAYFCPDVDGAPLLFCGDTLFSGGCGRLFEGTPAQMLASLDALAALPTDTRVCCAHEYTLSNLRFARAVEPGNLALAEYQAAARRPVGTHPPRLRHARPGQRPGARPRAVVRQPARLHPAHDRALSKYLFHIVEELERRNMPTELALLPFIESAFNPQAVSSAKAAGMWQFMPATGQHFRAQAERVPRRPARRAGLDPRRTGLPAKAARHVWRLAPGAGRLQLGRRQRRPRHRQATSGAAWAPAYPT
jgi:hydroxyacylglutathione hydrolase